MRPTSFLRDLMKHPLAVYWSGGLIALDWIGRAETAFDILHLPFVKGWHFQALAWVLLAAGVGVLMARQGPADAAPPVEADAAREIAALKEEVASLRAQVRAGLSRAEDA